jgi:hypothetical protein
VRSCDSEMVPFFQRVKNKSCVNEIDELFYGRARMLDSHGLCAVVGVSVNEIDELRACTNA